MLFTLFATSIDHRVDWKKPEDAKFIGAKHSDIELCQEGKLKFEIKPIARSIGFIEQFVGNKKNICFTQPQWNFIIIS